MVSHPYLYDAESGFHRGYLYAHEMGTASAYVRNPDATSIASGVNRVDDARSGLYVSDQDAVFRLRKQFSVKKHLVMSYG